MAEPTQPLSPAARLRGLVADASPLVLPGVFDALSARLAAAAGFPALVISGFSVSASRLGLPDVGHLTQTEGAAVARDVSAAVGAPVLVDADTGYGNAMSAARTARLLHQAGAAGLIIEDQEWPKRCGHMEGKRVVGADEWLAKLRAVLDLRSEGADLYLVARTDARATHSLDEALGRGRAARDLGVDAVFVEAPESPAEMERVAAGVPGVTLVANMVEGGRTPLMAPADAAALGFGVVLWGISGVLAAAGALARTYARLARSGRTDPDDGLMTFAEITAAVGLPEHRERERRYGGGTA